MRLRGASCLCPGACGASRGPLPHRTRCWHLQRVEGVPGPRAAASLPKCSPKSWSFSAPGAPCPGGQASPGPSVGLGGAFELQPDGNGAVSPRYLN